VKSSIKAVVLVAFVAFSAAECSSGGSGLSLPPTTSTTTAPQVSTSTSVSTAPAGTAYLADIAPVNAAIAAFGPKASAWSSSTTNAQAVADARPLVTALQTLKTTLTDGSWPATATTDMHMLVGNIGALIGDLQGLSTVNLLDASGFRVTVQRDGLAEKTASGLVRHDLGLPPQSSSG
jgi:hypothetical protein